MASNLPSKIFIQVESSVEQQENMKGTRKAFNKITNAPIIDKENLIARSPAYVAKEALIKKTSFEEMQATEMKRKTPTASTSSQTSPEASTSSSSSSSSKQKVTAEDLTLDRPINERYWETLAEKRREALEETLFENQELYERIANLEDELSHSKSMLEEARDLVTVLTEMLEEKEQNDVTRNSVETEPSDTSNLDMTL